MRQLSRNRSQLWFHSRSPTRNSTIPTVVGNLSSLNDFLDLSDMNRSSRLLSQGSEEGSLLREVGSLRPPGSGEVICCLTWFPGESRDSGFSCLGCSRTILRQVWTHGPVRHWRLFRVIPSPGVIVVLWLWKAPLWRAQVFDNRGDWAHRSMSMAVPERSRRNKHL